MKKLIFALVIVFTGFSVGNAQFMESLQIGVKGGYNYSNLSIADKPDTFKADGLHGFHLGLFVEVPIMDKLSVQPEVVYSVQGNLSNFKFQRVDFGSTFLYETEALAKLNYLSVPIMFKYYIINGLSINFGPQISFLSSVNIKTKKHLSIEGVQDPVEEGAYNSKDSFKSIDYGLGLGATYKIEAVEGLAISARYNHGFSKIIEDEGLSGIIVHYRYPSNTKNRVIQVGLSYQL